MPLLPVALLALTQDLSTPAEARLAALAAAEAPDTISRTRELPSGTIVEARAQASHGRHIAHGPDWTATFSADGLAFTPVLGKQAPRTRTLTFALESIAVGGRAIGGLDLTARPETRDAVHTAYRRSASVTELYEARPEGLEQSFVFTELPSRAGDLVVRGRLGGNLAPAAGATGPDALRFEPDAHGGARLDTVLGLDAAGRTTTGTLTLDGDVLELRLPAEFVAAAELPLVLDPLFGTLAPVNSGGGTDLQGDLTFGEEFNEYVVVFERSVSAVRRDIYVRPFDELGSPTLAAARLDMSDDDVIDEKPSIAYQRNQRTLLVAWEESGAPQPTHVLVAALDQNSFLPSSPLELGPGRNPDVGGESELLDSRCVVVYEGDDGTTIDLRAVGVSVPAAIAPSVAWITVLPGTSQPSGPGGRVNPAISKSGGSQGLYSVASWTLFSSGDNLQLHTLDIGGGATTSVGIATPPGSSLLPAVPDTDVGPNGDDGLVVWNRSVPPGQFGTPGANDVYAIAIEYDGTRYVPLPATSRELDPAGDNELLPAVARVGGRYLVVYESYESPVATSLEYVARTLNPDCSDCETTQLLSSVVLGPFFDPSVPPRVAARESGAGAPAPGFGSAGLLFTTSSDLAFQRYDEVGSGSTQANAGGGCGTAGSIDIVGDTYIGSPAYDVTLTGADPMATVAILNYSANPLTIPCGTCEWLPFKNTFVEPVAAGSATKGLLVPCLPLLNGVTFSFQWTVLLTGTSPCITSPNISFSDRMTLTLGY